VAGLDLVLDLEDLVSAIGLVVLASASEFWPRLTSLLINGREGRSDATRSADPLATRSHADLFALCRSAAARS